MKNTNLALIKKRNVDIVTAERGEDGTCRRNIVAESEIGESLKEKQTVRVNVTGEETVQLPVEFVQLEAIPDRNGT